MALNLLTRRSHVFSLDYFRKNKANLKSPSVNRPTKISSRRRFFIRASLHTLWIFRHSLQNVIL